MSDAVRRMYARIDRGYELVNHLFSLGLDGGWRRRAAALAADRGGERWLDVCTGTGEMAIDLRRLAPEETTVVGLDFSAPMLGQARAKSGARGVSLVLGDAGRLPFDDESFDLATISFATRNLKAAGPLEVFFSEVRRVLRPGGSFVHLETSQPESDPIRAMFRAYVRTTITPLGRIVTGAPGPYRFLTKSVLRFHDSTELSEILGRAGFSEVEVEPLLLGAVAIHHAVR